MIKRLSAVIVAVVVFLSIIGLSWVSLSAPSGYAVGLSGHSYSPAGEQVAFGPDARYDYVDGDPVLYVQSKPTVIDKSRLLFLDDETMFLLNTAAAIDPEDNIVDLAPKTELVGAGFDGFVATPTHTGTQDAGGPVKLGIGTIVKLADGRYQFLDSIVLCDQKAGDDCTEVDSYRPGSVVWIQPDESFFVCDSEACEQYPSTLGKTVHLQTEGSIFRLYDEVLQRPSGKTVRLSQLLVDPDSDPRDIDLSRSRALANSPSPSPSGTGTPSATPSPSPTPEQPTTTAPSAQPVPSAGAGAGAGDGGTGDGNGDGKAKGDGDGGAGGQNGATASPTPLPTMPVLPDRVPEWEDMSSYIPVVSVSAYDSGTGITMDGRIADVGGRLLTLRTDIYEKGSDVAIDFASLDASSPTFSWTSDALVPGRFYTATVSGTYLDSSGVARDIVFFAQDIQYGRLDLSHTNVQEAAHSIGFDLSGDPVPPGLERLTLSYAKNGSKTPLGTVDIAVADLKNGAVPVTISGLDSRTTYLVSVSSAVVNGTAIKVGWTANVTTTAELPTISSVNAEYSSSAKQFTLSPVGFTDPDETVRQLRYAAFRSEDIAECGDWDQADYAQCLSTKSIMLSYAVERADVARPATVKLPSGFPHGDYTFVAVLTGNDGVRDFVIYSSPSESGEVTVTTSNPPTATLTSLPSSVTSSSFEVRYEVLDPDGTIIALNDSQRPALAVYLCDDNGDGTGTKQGEAVKVTYLQPSQAVAGGISTFTTLAPATTYCAEFTLTYDLGDGPQKITANAEPVTTHSIDPLVVTFDKAKSEEVTADSFTVRATFSPSAEQLASVSYGLFDTRGDLVQGTLGSLNATELRSYLSTGSRWEMVFTDLTADTSYEVRFFDASDQGENDVPTRNVGNWFTTKQPGPKVTGVGIAASSDLNGVVAELKYADDARAITRVDYYLYDSDTDTPECDDAGVCAFPDGAQPAALGQISQSGFEIGAPVRFDFAELGAQRGKVYWVNAIVTWSDNLDSFTIMRYSDMLAMEKGAPTATVRLLERTAGQAKVEVTLTDLDEAILDGGQTAYVSWRNPGGGASRIPLDVRPGGQATTTVTIPTSDAVTFEVTAIYALVGGSVVNENTPCTTSSGDPQPCAVLQYQWLPSYKQVDTSAPIFVGSTLSNRLNQANMLTRVLDFGPGSYDTGSGLGSQVIDADYRFFVNGEAEPSATAGQTTDQVFQQIALTLPQGNLAMDGEDRSIRVDASARYRTDGFVTSTTQAVGSVIYLATVDKVSGQLGYVSSQAGSAGVVVRTHGTRTTAYRVEQGSVVASTGNFQNVKLRDLVTGNCLAYQGQAGLTEASCDVAAPMAFIKLPDGSYAWQTSDGNMLITQSASQALSQNDGYSRFLLFDAGSIDRSIDPTSTASFERLAAPSVEVLFAGSDEEIIDTRIPVSVLVADPNDTAVQAPQNAGYETWLVAYPTIDNLPETGPDTSKQPTRVRLTGLHTLDTAKVYNLSELTPGTYYWIQVESLYNLADGGADVQAILKWTAGGFDADQAHITVKTDEKKPTVVSNAYTAVRVCGSGGATALGDIQSNLKYEDRNTVTQDVVYKIYKKSSFIDGALNQMRIGNTARYNADAMDVYLDTRAEASQPVATVYEQSTSASGFSSGSEQYMYSGSVSLDMNQNADVADVHFQADEDYIINVVFVTRIPGASAEYVADSQDFRIAALAAPSFTITPTSIERNSVEFTLAFKASSNQPYFQCAGTTRVNWEVLDLSNNNQVASGFFSASTSTTSTATGIEVPEGLISGHNYRIRAWASGYDLVLATSTFSSGATYRLKTVQASQDFQTKTDYITASMPTITQDAAGVTVGVARINRSSGTDRVEAIRVILRGYTPEQALDPSLGVTAIATKTADAALLAVLNSSGQQLLDLAVLFDGVDLGGYQRIQARVEIDYRVTGNSVTNTFRIDSFAVEPEAFRGPSGAPITNLSIDLATAATGTLVVTDLDPGSFSSEYVTFVVRDAGGSVLATRVVLVGDLGSSYSIPVPNGAVGIQVDVYDGSTLVKTATGLVTA